MSLRSGFTLAGLRARPVRLQHAHDVRFLWSYFGRETPPHATGKRDAPPHPSNARERPPHALENRGDVDSTSPESTRPLPEDIQVNQLVSRFKNAAWTKDLAGMHRFYTPIREAQIKRAASHPQARPFLDAQHMTDAMAVLAVGTTTGSTTLLDTLLADMQDVFGYPITEDVHRTILAAMLDKPKTLQPAFAWLRTMQQKPGHVAPSLQLWHDYLLGAVAFGSPGMIRRAVRDMSGMGAKPTNATYQIVIQGIAQEAPLTFEMATELMDEMRSVGLLRDMDTLDAFCEAFRSQGMADQEDQVRAAYERRFAHVTAPRTSPEEEQFYDELANLAIEKGVPAAVDMWRTVTKKVIHKGRTPLQALKAILRHSYKISELREAEKQLNIAPDFDVWLMLVKNAVVKGDSGAAVTLYNRARNEGIQHNPQMAEYVIHSLCFNARSIRGPSANDIDHALALYRALCTAADHDINASGPTASIYKSLLRALSTSQHAKKYLPVVVRLLEEMNARGFSNESILLQHAIIALMRASPTHDDAYEAYERMHKDHVQDSNALNQVGYHKILDAFCKLQTPERTLPKPSQYFNIVRHMREAGHPVTPNVYTIMLNHLGYVATHSSAAAKDPDARSRLLAIIRRTHDHLTLDPNITPDGHLWNQLMDTYQRAGSPGDALRVWEMMYIQGLVNEVSVSIVIDACSFAGSYSAMVDIWTKLRERHFPLNRRNWLNWVEGLCRVGRLSEAVEVVCKEMTEAGIPPNQDVARVLLKFARSYDRAPEVREQIRERLPELWNELPADLRPLDSKYPDDSV